MSQVEGKRLLVESFKSIATLSSSAILVIVAFMKDVFIAPCHPWVVIVSLISLVISVIASGLVMVLLSSDVLNEADLSAQTHPGLGIVVLSSAIGGFLVGMIGIVAFFVINI
ncbi:hypothetical protein [Modicisalibacter radicis]|uniref:hypothetical protein n=1 Tax=Halomonas sp. EAR18 TaxID=2518972 RepID=UPI00109D0747|nr:hypothetical protein [Halomonas sp. EAR18]